MKTPLGLQAYVLHAWDWRESSLVLDVFSREQGRIGLVAKGAKRPTSSLRGVLLPMQRLQIQLTKTKAQLEEGGDEIHTLKSAEWQATHPLPQGGALLAAYYCNELLQRLLPRGEPQPPLFDAYAATLQGLALASGPPEAWLRAFELALLGQLGWLPQLDVDSLRQQALRPGARYQLSAELGLVDSSDGSGLSGSSWALLAGAQGVPAQAAAVLQLPDRSQLKAVLRQVLHYHLGHAPLRSRAVLHQAHDLLAR